MLSWEYIRQDREIVRHLKQRSNSMKYSDRGNAPVDQRIKIRKRINPNLIKPYTESELRRKVKNWSTNESVVYNARLFANERVHNRTAQKTWSETIIKQKPKLGQARFWACMHLADHDYENSK